MFYLLGNKLIKESIKDINCNIIKGPLLLKQNIFHDNRGFFYESWNEEVFNKSVNTSIKFVQDNISYSKKGVLRGLHFQIPPKGQSKLVRVISGLIYDVIVDLRINSPTFSCWCGLELDNIENNQLWVPEGFAHGFLTLSDSAIVQYKVDKYWSKHSERSLRWDDNEIGISWPLERCQFDYPIISDKDKNSKSIKRLKELGEIFL